MTKVIVYKNNDIISVVIPAPDYLRNHSINEIGDKDVPEGLDYWVVENFDGIPREQEDRLSWFNNNLISIAPSGKGQLAPVSAELPPNPDPFVEEN